MDTAPNAPDWVVSEPMTVHQMVLTHTPGEQYLVPDPDLYAATLRLETDARVRLNPAPGEDPFMLVGVRYQLRHYSHELTSHLQAQDRTRPWQVDLLVTIPEVGLAVMRIPAWQEMALFSLYDEHHVTGRTHGASPESWYTITMVEQS